MLSYLAPLLTILSIFTSNASTMSPTDLCDDRLKKDFFLNEDYIIRTKKNLKPNSTYDLSESLLVSFWRSTIRISSSIFLLLILKSKLNKWNEMNWIDILSCWTKRLSWISPLWLVQPPSWDCKQDFIKSPPVFSLVF